ADAGAFLDDADAPRPEASVPPHRFGGEADDGVGPLHLRERDLPARENHLRLAGAAPGLRAVALGVHHLAALAPRGIGEQHAGEDDALPPFPGEADLTGVPRQRTVARRERRLVCGAVP